MSRRGFLRLALIGSSLAGISAFIPLQPRSRLVRPPGAVVEDKFLSLCIRCGLCIEKCVTGTLEPSTILDGPAVWATPKVNAVRAPCEAVGGRCEGILPCVEACPTGALVKVDTESIKMGSVRWVKENCIAYLRKGGCLVCFEVCPIRGAIVPVDKVPTFNPDKCVGCGRCVCACPPDPKALYLVPDGERRVENV